MEGKSPQAMTDCRRSPPNQMNIVSRLYFRLSQIKRVKFHRQAHRSTEIVTRNTSQIQTKLFPITPFRRDLRRYGRYSKSVWPRQNTRARKSNPGTGQIVAPCVSNLK